MAASPDRAPRSRIWRALTDAGEFGTLFGVDLDGQFATGTTVRGRSTYPGYEHLTIEMSVERMEPERLFSYRRHPYAVNPEADYSTQPTTLVELAPGAATASSRTVRSATTGRPTERAAPLHVPL
jgi:hypothetical protein